MKIYKMLNVSMSNGGANKHLNSPRDKYGVMRKLAHNHREYLEYNETRCKSNIDFDFTAFNFYHTSPLSFEQWFNRLFQKDVDEHNAKQTRKDRLIESAYKYYQKNAKNHQLAREIIFSIGDANSIGDINKKVLSLKKNDPLKKEWIEYWTKKPRQLHNKIFKNFNDFKVYDVSLHLDESTPHFHILGTPTKYNENAKRGFKHSINNDILNLYGIKKLHEVFADISKEMINEINELSYRHDLTNNQHFFEYAENKEVSRDKLIAHNNQLWNLNTYLVQQKDEKLEKLTALEKSINSEIDNYYLHYQSYTKDDKTIQNINKKQQNLENERDFGNEYDDDDMELEF